MLAWSASLWSQVHKHTPQLLKDPSGPESDAAALISSGGEITSTFEHPELVKLGQCKLIEEVMIGEDMLIHFSGVAMGT